MIGALRWISYINPLRYAFESVVANEFHTISGICSNLIPRGPGYEGVSLSNQVCTMVGAVHGQSTVDGNRFIQLSYGYTYSNVWRNFGIVCAFATGFIFILLIFTEINTSISGNSSMVLFKRGAKHAPLKKSDSADEEKGMVGSEPLSEQDKEVSENVFDTAPVTKDVFSWQHLKYSVPVSGGYRVLLDDVSGYVVPGKLTALMGESGAGKTTLLNVLAQRVDTGVVEGEQFINGQLPPLDVQSQSGYCQQMDTHTPTDTVREALRFSASLRQPSCVPKAEKYAYVEECLKMCGLEKYANATVGSLNVEFRKRTTIAIELAAKPKLLLFLDEPTSGLDSQSSWAIMKFLRTLVDNGQAILCTLLLLRRGGQTVYFGELGYNTTTLIRYFEKNGSRLCEPDENPAEFMLDVIGAGATASANTNWHKIWKDSHEFVEVQKELEMIHGEGQNHPPVTQTLHTEFATSWLHQTGELLARNSRAFWRDPTYISAKLALDIFAGLFIGAVYMSTILAAPLSNQIQVPFLNARKIYEIRERPSQMYSWTALVTSQYLSELPWDILGSSLYFLCWYWTVGFDTSRAGYTYLMLGVMFPAYYTSLAMCVAALAPSTEIAAPLFSVLFLFVIAFNGVLQPYHELHWWKWM
ncbi:hypothetical protein H0H93_004452 [Arthromyces matolae]|nr:hypothetical protein H0H93_004452 [Arthromyces matolae]